MNESYLHGLRAVQVWLVVKRLKGSVFSQLGKIILQLGKYFFLTMQKVLLLSLTAFAENIAPIWLFYVNMLYNTILSVVFFAKILSFVSV